MPSINQVLDNRVFAKSRCPFCKYFLIRVDEIIFPLYLSALSIYQLIIIFFTKLFQQTYIAFSFIAKSKIYYLQKLG